MTVKTRSPGKDLLKKTRLDEAFKGFIMLGSAGVYSATYFGWWNSLKLIINFSDDIFLSSAIHWDRVAILALLLAGISLVAIPGLHLGFAWISQKISKDKNTPLINLFTEYAYFAVPLGFMAWVGFVAEMVMVNGSYIISSLSDPLGFGWNLFGTAGYPWTPYFTELIPYVQLTSILAGGILASIVIFNVSKKYFKDAFKASVPGVIEVSILTLLLVFLYVLP